MLKRLLKKTLEIISYLLIFGIIYRLLQRNHEPINDVQSKLDKIDEQAETEFDASQTVFEMEIKEADDEQERINNLDNDSLASEFDSEF